METPSQTHPHPRTRKHQCLLHQLPMETSLAMAQNRLEWPESMSFLKLNILKLFIECSVVSRYVSVGMCPYLFLLLVVKMYSKVFLKAIWFNGYALVSCKRKYEPIQIQNHSLIMAARCGLFRFFCVFHFVPLYSSV